MSPKELIDKLYQMHPDARCELEYQDDFTLLAAILLSAQTTDKQVNKITPSLFANYPTAEALSNACYDDVVAIIRPLGLAKNKAKYLISLAKAISDEYDGKVPRSVDELERLPGVGHKTASVFMAEFYGEPHVAVDTHVLRVSNRLGLATSDDVKKVERCLEEYFDREDYIKAHLGLLFLGRYTCKSQNPDCQSCLLKEICKEYKNR